MGSYHQRLVLRDILSPSDPRNDEGNTRLVIATVLGTGCIDYN